MPIRRSRPATVAAALLLLAGLVAAAGEGCGGAFEGSGAGAGAAGGSGGGGCPEGFADCDGVGGCETNLSSDVEHCGSCGSDCAESGWPNVSSYGCEGARCEIDACVDGFAHCSSTSADGCEVDTTSDPNNCGGCGYVCSSGLCDDSRCVRILYASYALKNWGSTMADANQWSAPLVLNPNPTETDVTVLVHRVDSDEEPYVFSKTIPAQAAWSGHGDAEWLALPNTAAAGALGWVELRASSDILAVNVVDIRQGEDADGVLRLRDVEPFVAKIGTRLWPWAFLKRWISPTTGDLSHTQWTSLVLCNPQETEQMATITVRDRTSGDVVTSFNKWIPPRQWWNAYADPDWNDIGSESEFAWLEVTSGSPLLGSNRWILKAGTANDSPAVLLDDLGLTGEARRHQMATIYLRRWPWGTGGRSQWSNLIIGNPNDSEAVATITVHRADAGADLGQLVVPIPAHAMWYSRGDAAWSDVELSEPANQRSIGWVEVRSDLPVVGANVVDLVWGNNEADPLFTRDVNGLAQSATTLHGSSYLRDWDAGDGSGRTEQTSIVVTNANDEAVTLTVTVRRVDDGEILSAFDKVVPAKGAWNSYADPDWESVPETTTGAAEGWVTIAASAPVAGSLRYRLDALDGTAAVVDEHPLLVVGE